MTAQERRPSSRYTRNATGVTVHREDCVRPGKRVPWLYAEGFTADQIVSTLAEHPWLKPCKSCRPDKGSTHA